MWIRESRVENYLVIYRYCPSAIVVSEYPQSYGINILLGGRGPSKRRAGEGLCVTNNNNNNDKKE